ncbi:murein DD-endopeptidase MepM/ murein hydrolase activator NlpD [Neolewinella xylanilytica]|uniref:Murein DD-endopeptidase MepM/ murein hydrolase activator NlpD n=1 Tax=Neolewinella xylanilytica TaxID=1514080 RepID=A0A2S6I0Q2_9BACT|nr:murein DD-endopeptidase MepM/ murein hydrolase activator NlpD [Neolewinella xylanilytica]
MVVSIALGSTIIGGLVAASPPPPKTSKQPLLKPFPIIEPTVRYGVALDTFSVDMDTIQYGQTLSDILLATGMQPVSALAASNKFNEMLDVRNLRAGLTYQLLDDPDTEGPDYLIYSPSVYRYLKLDLQGAGQDEYVDLPIRIEEGLAAGKIESSLWNAMVDSGHSFALTDKMEDALQWSVDFYHVQKGDAFQLVYEQEYVAGTEAGFGRVKAARYSTGGKDIYAFYFVSQDSSQQGYFGLDGQPMKSLFLKAPVRYSRISSRYNLTRFHPVQRRVKPHLGTDYAAPYGTPIVAVADGTISKSGRTGGNGIYVKIRHDKRYATQYLHMQKRAPGMVVGKRVSQGDVIGYVGSTGLATGPHVCFRFWDNGRQVDHTRMDFQDAEPMPDEYLPEFFELRDTYLAQLNSVGEPVEAPVPPVSK